MLNYSHPTNQNGCKQQVWPCQCVPVDCQPMELWTLPEVIKNSGHIQRCCLCQPRPASHRIPPSLERPPCRPGSPGNTATGGGWGPPEALLACGTDILWHTGNLQSQSRLREQLPHGSQGQTFTGPRPSAARADSQKDHRSNLLLKQSQVCSLPLLPATSHVLLPAAWTGPSSGLRKGT